MMSFNMQIKVQREEMRNDTNILSKKRQIFYKISITKNFFNGIILPIDDSKSTLDEYNSLVMC